MKRALARARTAVSMLNSGSRSTSLEIAKKTDSSEEELQALVSPSPQKKDSDGVLRLDVQGENRT